MKTYHVTISDHDYKIFEIQANSSDEAEDKVLDGHGVCIHEKTLEFDIDTEEITN